MVTVVGQAVGVGATGGAVTRGTAVGVGEGAEGSATAAPHQSATRWTCSLSQDTSRYGHSPTTNMFLFLTKNAFECLTLFHFECFTLKMSKHQF